MNIALLSLLLAATPASNTSLAVLDGAKIVSRGTPAGVPACAACHGDTLRGNPATGAPAISGLPADYIMSRLEHYAGPTGHNATMKQVATKLTAGETRAVARYIAGLPPATSKAAR